MVRVFVCSSCGKSIEIARCTNRRERDLQCPDCGGRVYREHGEAGRLAGGRGERDFAPVVESSGLNAGRFDQFDGPRGKRGIRGEGRGRAGRSFHGRRSG